MTKIHEVYQAIADLAQNGYCELEQKQLAQLVNVSVRHLYRLIADLRDLGVIKTELIHNKLGHRHKTRFQLISLSDIQSHLGSPKSRLSDIQSHLGEPKCHQESLRPLLMNHDNDDDRRLKEKNRKLILEVLDFLDLNGRLKLLELPHLDLGYAELARRYVDHLKATKQWQPQYSPGRIYRLIERAEIPTQFDLPEAVMDTSADQSKSWYSVDEAHLIQH